MSNALMPTGEVHPVADLFPMLPDDELAELAADIAANGLQQPIVLDDAGTLIDGRNRWAACQMASVEPRFVALNGADPVAYILSANVHRRHISAGQRAMAVAEAHKFSSGKFQRKRAAANDAGISSAHLSKAVAVLEFAPELSGSVREATLSLTEAYEQARQRKLAQEARDDAAAQQAALAANAPDLAELVETEKMTLREALAAWRERQHEDRERRKRNVAYFENAVTMLWSLLDPDPELIAEEWIDGIINKMTVDYLGHLQTGNGLRQLTDLLASCAMAVDRRGGLA